MITQQWNCHKNESLLWLTTKGRLSIYDKIVQSIELDCEVVNHLNAVLITEI